MCGATSHDTNPTFDVYGSRWTHGTARLIFLPFLADWPLGAECRRARRFRRAIEARLSF